MPQTPDRKPGALIEEEIKLETNASPSNQPGSVHFNGSAVIVVDATGSINLRDVADAGGGGSDAVAKALAWMGW